MAQNGFYLEDIPFNVFMKYFYNDNGTDTGSGARYVPEYTAIYSSKLYSHDLTFTHTNADSTTNEVKINFLTPIKMDYDDADNLGFTELYNALDIDKTKYSVYSLSSKTLTLSTNASMPIYMFPAIYKYRNLGKGISVYPYCGEYSDGSVAHYFPFCTLSSSNTDIYDATTNTVVGQRSSTIIYDKINNAEYYNFLKSGIAVGKLYVNRLAICQKTTLDSTDATKVYYYYYDTENNNAESSFTLDNLPKSTLENYRLLRNKYYEKISQSYLQYDNDGNTTTPIAISPSKRNTLVGLKGSGATSFAEIVERTLSGTYAEIADADDVIDTDLNTDVIVGQKVSLTKQNTFTALTPLTYAMLVVNNVIPSSTYYDKIVQNVQAYAVTPGDIYTVNSFNEMRSGLIALNTDYLRKDYFLTQYNKRRHRWSVPWFRRKDYFLTQYNKRVTEGEIDNILKFIKTSMASVSSIGKYTSDVFTYTTFSSNSLAQNDGLSKIIYDTMNGFFENKGYSVLYISSKTSTENKNLINSIAPSTARDSNGNVYSWFNNHYFKMSWAEGANNTALNKFSYILTLTPLSTILGQYVPETQVISTIPETVDKKYQIINSKLTHATYTTKTVSVATTANPLSSAAKTVDIDTALSSDLITLYTSENSEIGSGKYNERISGAAKNIALGTIDLSKDGILDRTFVDANAAEEMYMICKGLEDRGEYAYSENSVLNEGSSYVDNNGNTINGFVPLDCTTVSKVYTLGTEIPENQKTYEYTKPKKFELDNAIDYVSNLSVFNRLSLYENYELNGRLVNDVAKFQISSRSYTNTTQSENIYTPIIETKQPKDSSYYSQHNFESRRSLIIDFILSYCYSSSVNETSSKSPYNPNYTSFKNTFANRILPYMGMDSVKNGTTDNGFGYDALDTTDTRLLSEKTSVAEVKVSFAKDITVDSKTFIKLLNDRMKSTD
jgi:hypothetical protein